MPEPITHIIHVRPELPVTMTEAGTGRIALILHGGGGPFTVAPIAGHLAATMHTIIPVHPGWNGTERTLDTVADIARTYLEYLAQLDARDVLVIGSSLGGWIAAEMAVSDADKRIGQVVLINAVGVAVIGSPIRDFFALDARGVAEYSFHDSEKFYRDPAAIPPEQAAIQARNMVSMKAYTGDPSMHDPTLLARVAGVQIPTLVVWGESDGIVTPTYGAAWAAAFPNARFELVREAGHLPQIEQPVALFELLDGFIE